MILVWTTTIVIVICIRFLANSQSATTMTKTEYNGQIKNNYSNFTNFVNLEAHPSVQSMTGIIRGKYLNKGQVAAFLGIPYAKPPVNDLRFRKTVPLDPSDEIVVYADHPGPACPQSSTAPLPWADKQPGQNEDCLYLNIWVPLLRKVKLDIIFWIHGGGFICGSNRMEIYDGKILADRGDIIVVTINYRLGPLGFAYMGKSSDIPGNMGLYDMQEALKWIYENIDNFGGDKHKITIAGESVGGVSVWNLIASEISTNYIKRMIIESGNLNPLAVTQPEANLNQTLDLAKQLGCAPTDTTEINNQAVVKCLKS